MINHFSHIKVDNFNTIWTPRVQTEPLPPNIPTDLLSEFPRLKKILSEIHHPWNNLYWETWPPAIEAMNWGWASFENWSLDAQKGFDEIWSAEGDKWIDSLIDEYGSNWHNALPILISRDYPEFLDKLKSSCTSGKITIHGKYKNEIDLVVNSALLHGPWLRTVNRRDWEFPSSKYCSICGLGYYADTVRYYLIRKWGDTSICPRCMFIASYGIPTTSPLHRNFTKNQVINYLRDFASLIQFIPPQSFRETISNSGFDQETLIRIIAVMICLPTVDKIKKTFGNVSWLEVLQNTKLVEEAWRPARGTFCIAKDGHLCRSLAERSIDDWFTKHGITHEPEPYWPKDTALNPNGKFRADWKLPDGTFVEYAGLNTEEYLFKIDNKRKLAIKTGIKLIIVFPEDLQRLDFVFAEWIN